MLEPIFSTKPPIPTPPSSPDVDRNTKDRRNDPKISCILEFVLRTPIISPLPRLFRSSPLMSGFCKVHSLLWSDSVLLNQRVRAYEREREFWRREKEKIYFWKIKKCIVKWWSCCPLGCRGYFCKFIVVLYHGLGLCGYAF